MQRIYWLPLPLNSPALWRKRTGPLPNGSGDRLMRELVRTNDPVLLSFVRALLDDAGIAYDVFDQHTSNTLFWLETIQSRLMVASVQYDRAVVVMTSAGLEGHIHDPD